MYHFQRRIIVSVRLEAEGEGAFPEPIYIRGSRGSARDLTLRIDVVFGGELRSRSQQGSAKAGARETAVEVLESCLGSLHVYHDKTKQTS
jgi:hypothetical protein